MTPKELARLGEEVPSYELVDGRLVRMRVAGGRHGRIGMRLGGLLDRFVEEHDLGVVLAAETGFYLGNAR